jgi:hypothetical protein
MVASRSGVRDVKGYEIHPEPPLVERRLCAFKRGTPITDAEPNYVDHAASFGQMLVNAGSRRLGAMCRNMAGDIWIYRRLRG